MSELHIDPKTTALIGIDMHAGLNLPYAPYTYAEVSENAINLAQAAAKQGMFIDLTQIPVTDGKDRVQVETDTPLATPAKNHQSIAAPTLIPELVNVPGVHVTPKIAWSGFYGTDLDMELRRRGVRTVILFGVATEYGVDSTARDAYDRGYNQIFVSDAMTAWSDEAQQFEQQAIFTKIGKVRTTKEIIAAFREN